MLQGQVALVTGATRGIGKAIALGLGAQGAKVIGTSTSPAGAKAIGEYLVEAKVGGKGVVLEVNDGAAIDALVAEIEKEFGAVGILVNNAGITQDNLAMRMKEAEWDAVIDTDLKSVFRLSRAVLRGMMKARAGRIINITSVVAVTGNPGQGNYTAAKAGMIGMFKSIAKEYARRGVTANCVAPGFVATAMTDKLNDKQREAILQMVPSGRLGTPDDIAAAVVYLASEEASYVTGQTLHVNGGMAMI